MNEREILERSINDHQSAIDKAQKELGALEVTYSIGDRFKYNDEKFLLVEDCWHGNVTAVKLSTGGALNSPYKVSTLDADPSTLVITKEQMEHIIHGFDSAVRYWDNRKKVRV